MLCARRVLLTCVPLPLQAGHGLRYHQNTTIFERAVTKKRGDNEKGSLSAKLPIRPDIPAAVGALNGVVPTNTAAGIVSSGRELGWVISIVLVGHPRWDKEREIVAK